MASLTPIVLESARLRMIATVNGKATCEVILRPRHAPDTAPPLAMDVVNLSADGERRRFLSLVPSSYGEEAATLLLQGAEATVAHRVTRERKAAAGELSPTQLQPAAAVSPAEDEASPAFTPGERCTDVGNARRFIRQHGRDLRYVHAWNAWLCWDGTRWQVDRTQDVVRRAKATVRTIYLEAAAEADHDQRARLAKHAAASEAAARVAAMVSLAQSEPEVAITPEQLDVDPWVLNVQNGTLDLRTGELRPHRREDLLTKLAGVAYDAAARCPRFEEFLLEVLHGDVPLALYVQRALGYTLIGEPLEHALLFLHGVGRNGKSTFLELVAAMLGDYATSADIATFLERKGAAGGARPDLLNLRGARFVSAVEAGHGARFDEGLVKQLTGGDRIKARGLYHNTETEFRASFTIWLAANTRPVVRGTDHAIWSRIKLVPFTVTIPPERIDRDLPTKLREELPGLLNWCLDGLRMWQQIGLGSTAAVTAATEAYREEMDDLRPFLDACCELAADAEAPAQALYQAYTAWAEGTGERVLSATAFGRKLTERGFGKERRERGIVRLGLRLPGRDA